MATKPFCTVPFVEAFLGYRTAFRNCCATDPAIHSLPGQTFVQWQQDPRLVQFRENMYLDQWPAECEKCRIQEQQSGHSFRTSVNSQITMDENFDMWPSRWNLIFGNTCNLGCWICDEHSSSVIAQHKKTINILPADFVDPNDEFESQWKTLEQSVLASYDYHDTVTLTLLGGEPLYNKTLDSFLCRLQDLGLASRTRLEFHTNGTKINKKLFSADIWNYICIFLSLDAVGKKAEWLRYGCRWADIENNIEFFKSVGDYVEVHCTLGILNINDLPELKSFCESQQLPLKVLTLSSPEFMSLTRWCGDPRQITDRDSLEQAGFEYYYDLIGVDHDPDSMHNLANYIKQFDSIRKPLKDYDIRLYQAITEIV
jgi:organic radical activating enzyme